jgi:hypothetical protein
MRTLVVALLVAGALFNTPAVDAADAAEPPTQVPQWGRFERAVENNSRYNNPFADVELQVTFTSPSGRAVKFIGFYEGDGRGGRVRMIDVMHRQHRFNAVMGSHVKSRDSTGGNFDPWICNPYWNGSGHDFDRYNLTFWRRMDEVLDDLGDAGMILIPFGMVGGTNSDMVPLPPRSEQRIRLARYWTARWAGYWNATFQPQSDNDWVLWLAKDGTK